MGETAYLRVQGKLIDRVRLITFETKTKSFAMPLGERQVLGGPHVHPTLFIDDLHGVPSPIVLERGPDGLTVEATTEGRVRLNGEPLNGRATLAPGDAFELAGVLLFVHAQRPLPFSTDVNHWLRCCSSPDWDVRWTAIQMLGTLTPQRDDARAAFERAVREDDPMAAWARWALTLGNPRSLYLELQGPEYAHLPRIELPPGGSYVLGRHGSGHADIAIPHGTPSRRHAQIDHGEDWTVCDLGSMSGTLVNGRGCRDGSVTLVEGDDLQIGGVHLLVHTLPN